jgi:hypothetical protein
LKKRMRRSKREAPFTPLRSSADLSPSSGASTFSQLISISGWNGAGPSVMVK